MTSSPVPSHVLEIVCHFSNFVATMSWQNITYVESSSQPSPEPDAWALLRCGVKVCGLRYLWD